MSNFLISTGGSGGHVLQAIILYEHLEKKEKIIITTDKRGLNLLIKKNMIWKLLTRPN